MTIISDPLFYVIATPAVLFAGISKGGFGAGIGIVAVPAMALVVSPLQAAGIMLPILCLMDLFGVWAYRHHWDRRIYLSALPGGLVGVFFGAAFANHVEEHHIRLIVGIVAVVFALSHWLGRSVRRAQENPVKAGFWSSISGFTSFVGHAGGPPLSVYLLPLGLDKTIFVGTSAFFFATLNYVKLVPFAWLGQLSLENLGTALVLSPLCPLGIWLGLILHRRVSPVLFYRLCYLFVFLVGWKLLYDGTKPYWQ